MDSATSTNRSIGSISAPVTVFYGPNEAGKSTLLAFIRSIICSDSRLADSTVTIRRLDGGQHGGRIRLSDDAGMVYDAGAILAGVRGGLSVVTPSGPASDAETVLRQFTGAATSDLFKTVFAFSLDELQEAASLQGSSIYSTGQGVPRADAREDVKREEGPNLPKQARKQSGSTQAPELLKGVEEQQLKAVQRATPADGGLTAYQTQVGDWPRAAGRRQRRAF